jgi:hypothetical protein
MVLRNKLKNKKAHITGLTENATTQKTSRTTDTSSIDQHQEKARRSPLRLLHTLRCVDYAATPKFYGLRVAQERKTIKTTCFQMR